MSQVVARHIIVFGRGLEIDGSRIKLSTASKGRVDALLAYVTSHTDTFETMPGIVVFSGGYAGASEDIQAPEHKFRESNLMLEHVKNAKIEGRPLSHYVTLYAEAESISTLENVLNIHENGYFKDVVFSARNPLGLVAHATHFPRIEYFVHKILGLSGDQTQQIRATNKDRTESGIPESVMYYITRAAFFGVHRPTTFRKRERVMIHVVHLFRR